VRIAGDGQRTRFILDLDHKVDVRALISEIAPLSEGAACFARLYAREPGLLKIVLEP